MQVVNIHDAKTHFSKLVDIAMHGEEVVIAKAGRPVAKLGPLDTEQKLRRFGVLKNKIQISPDFDAPLPDEILSGFE